MSLRKIHEGMIDSSFLADINQRLEDSNQSVEDINQRVENVNQMIENMNQTIGDINHTIGGMNQTLETLRQQIEGSNSYTHPDTHPASMIIEDAQRRFVTDLEKSNWNNKASNALATSTLNGLMSSVDKVKLDGIITGATKVDVVDNLTTKDSTKALSAKKGSELKEQLDSNIQTLNQSLSNKASNEIATTSTNGLMSSSDKSKLNSIETGANNYTHPSTHPASIITEDSNRRFVTTTEIGNWNSHMTDLSHVFYASSTNSSNAYSVSIPAITRYVEGIAIAVKINAQNTGASTININGMGAKSIVKSNGLVLSSGNLKANSVYTLRYNGVNFFLQGEGGEYGTAVATDVLQGKTIGTDNGIVTGTMPNRGTWTTMPSQTGAVYIPAGYHNGNGYVTKVQPRYYEDTSVRTFNYSYDNTTGGTLLVFPSTTFNCGFRPYVWSIQVQLAFNYYSSMINFVLTWDEGSSYPMSSDFFTGSSALGNFWYNGSTCTVSNTGVTITGLNFMGQQWYSSLSASVKFRAIGAY